MPTVLVIAYFFPPDGGGGTQRMAKFCRYLPEFGWYPVVLTRKPGECRTFWDPEDPSLLSEIGQHTEVHRVSPDPQTPIQWARGLKQIDVGHDWLEPAYDQAGRIIEARRPDAILLTLGPYNLSHLARQLRRQHEVPLILDLRDPWAFDGWYAHRTRGRWKRFYRQMAETLDEVDAVIANTPEAGRVIAKRIPAMADKPMTVIPNGYDRTDFEPDLVGQANQTTEQPHAADQPDQTTFDLVHTGTLHSHCLYQDTWYEWLKRFRYRPEPMDPTGRTAFYLLQAIDQLKQQGGEIGPLIERLRLVLVGQPDEATRRCVSDASAGDHVKITGYLPHDQSVAWLAHSDGLFLPLHGLKPGHRSLIVPGKTYEYLATGRPILGSLPQGDARDLVHASGRGYLAQPCDTQAMGQALSQMLLDWRDGKSTITKQPAWIGQYERKALTQNLADFLNDITSSRCGFSNNSELIPEP